MRINTIVNSVRAGRFLPARSVFFVFNGLEPAVAVAPVAAVFAALEALAACAVAQAQPLLAVGIALFGLEGHHGQLRRLVLFPRFRFHIYRYC